MMTYEEVAEVLAAVDDARRAVKRARTLVGKTFGRTTGSQYMQFLTVLKHLDAARVALEAQGK